MFTRAFRVGRIAGIDVRIDPSWILLALLVVWSFHVQFGAAGRSTVTTLTMAVAAAGLFFASLLAHELGHALEGTHRGLEVHGITLLLFGGVTEMHLAPLRPRDEFAISAVGPYVSLVAGALFGIVATVVTAFGGPPAIADVAGALGWLNVLLALFNLIPGAPLDGGRVLRAAIWAVTRDRHRAVRLASYAGQAIAAVLVLLAVRLVVLRPEGIVTALWAGFIGWYMWRAAASERRRSEVEELLEGRTVATLSSASAPRLPVDRPIGMVADLIAASPGVEVFPVVALDDGPGIIGALRLEDVMDLDPHDRPFRDVGDLMRPAAELPTVSQDDDLLTVARAMQDGTTVAVVDGDGAVRTLVTAGQLQAALERWHALARRRGRRAWFRGGEHPGDGGP